MIFKRETKKTSWENTVYTLGAYSVVISKETGCRLIRTDCKGYLTHIWPLSREQAARILLRTSRNCDMVSKVIRGEMGKGF